MSRFRLYPEEQRWWSFSDHQFVLDVTRRLKPTRVLEFGPGSSTLALLEGGAASIDSCEDDPNWFAVYHQRLERRFPDRVRLHAYHWHEPLSIPALDHQTFDMALIDGPFETPRRPTVLAYALSRCTVVVMPTEESKTHPYLRPLILDLAKDHHRVVEITETGPLSGAFAVVSRPC